MKIINKLIFPFIKLFYSVKYKNIWNMKNSLKRKFNTNLYKVYLYNLQMNNSWVGYNSKFYGIPVFPHGLNGIYISDEAIIGKNAVIFHQVTIGSNTIKDSNFGSPKIGENVYIGTGAKIIGNITIGDNCRIGANAVIYKDLKPNSVAVCSETKIIQKKNLDNRYYTKKENIWVYYNNGEWLID